MSFSRALTAKDVATDLSVDVETNAGLMAEGEGDGGGETEEEEEEGGRRREEEEEQEDTTPFQDSTPCLSPPSTLNALTHFPK